VGWLCIVSINYEAPCESYVRLDIFDLSGKSIWSLSKRSHFDYRNQIVLWKGTSNSGSTVADGLYLIRMSGKDITSGATFLHTTSLFFSR
jgi:hypothetical protein